jgi:hypothetical protein
MKPAPMLARDIKKGSKVATKADAPPHQPGILQWRSITTHHQQGFPFSNS